MSATPANDDAALVLTMQRSESPGEREAAFHLLVARYWRSVVLLADSRLNSKSDAEEVAQEAFTRAWRSIDGLEQPGSFLGWLLRIVRNAIIDQIRRRRNDRAVQSNSSSSSIDAELASPGEGPEAETDRRDEIEAVSAAMERLPEKYQTVLTLRYLQDLPHEAIARALGEPIGTIRNRVFRALNLLRGVLHVERSTKS
jgi:RNA polymerase sigma-70 factor (ECF subfamily)